MPVRPFYDPSFDPGASVAVTYWTSFVGTRSNLNRERMAARLAKADPKFYQEQLDAIQKNINELLVQRQRASNSALQGMNRYLADYTKGSLQRDKAAMDQESDRIRAAADLAIARIGANVDMFELDSNERQFYAEMSEITQEDLNSISDTIATIIQGGVSSLEEAGDTLAELERALMETYDTNRSSPKGQLILASIGESIIAEQENNSLATPFFSEFLGEYNNQINRGRTPSRVRQDVGALFVDPALQRQRREEATAVGGVPGPSTTGSVVTSDPTSDALFRISMGNMSSMASDTFAGIDASIAQQRERMREVQEQRDRAMADADAIYTSAARNPLLQPVFFQSNPSRGRVRRQQDIVDAAAETARMDPTGVDLATRMRELSQAGGDARRMDPLDIPGPQKNLKNIADDTGDFLYSYIFREIGEIGSALQSTPDDGDTGDARRRFFDLYRMVNAVPPGDMSPAVKSSMEDAMAAFRNEQSTPAQMIATLNQEAAPGMGSLLQRVKGAYDDGDIHFAQIISDSITAAERAGAGSDEATEIIYNLVNFADIAGEDLGGALSTSLVNVYEQAEDPDVMQRAFLAARTVADDSMMQFEDAETAEILVPPLGRSVLEQQEADRNLAENAGTPTLEFKTPEGPEIRGGATEAPPIEQQSTALLERGDTPGTRVTVDPDGSRQTALGQQAARPYEQEPVPPPTPRQAAAERRQQRQDERPSTQEERQANRQQRRAERNAATAPPNKALSPDKPALVKPRPVPPSEPVRSKPVEDDVLAEALAPEPAPEVAAAPAPQAEPAPVPPSEPVRSKPAEDVLAEALAPEPAPEVAAAPAPRPAPQAEPAPEPAPRPAAAQDTSDPFWAKPVRSQNVMARDLERRVVVPEYTPEMERRAATVLRQIIVDGLDDGEAMPNITDRQLLEMARSFRPLVASGGYKALDNQINSERDQMYAPTGMTWFEYHEKADREGRTALSEALDRQAQAVNRRSRYLTDRQYERRREADQKFRDVVRQAGVQTFFQDVFTTFEEMQDYDSAFIPLLSVPPAN